jgi:hypothetical protein
MLLMAENLRTQSVWTAMMRAPEIQRGFAAADFRLCGASDPGCQTQQKP